MCLEDFMCACDHKVYVTIVIHYYKFTPLLLFPIVLPYILFYSVACTDLRRGWGEMALQGHNH